MNTVRTAADTNARAHPLVLTIVTPMPRSEPIKAVRGVRDLLLKERALWRAVETAAIRVARSFGYQQIATPVGEHRGLIERVGEDTDAVAKELYRFEDRGGRHL